MINPDNPMSADEMRLRRKKIALLKKKQARADRKRRFKKALIFIVVFILVFTFYEKGFNFNFNFNFKLDKINFDFFKKSKQGEDENSSPKSELEGKFIAYVPIDDRAIHTTRVVYLAESSGYDLKMPDVKFYKTYLTSGENSYNGYNTKFGNPSKIASWLLEMEENGCDYYILSIDQLFSGGLVGSQYLSDKDLAVYEKGIASAKKVFEKIVSDKNNHVYLIDSIMGLSVTPGFLDFTENDFSMLYAYSNVARPQLNGDDLTIKKIAENYPLNADGTSIASDLDLVKLNRYLAARERKLEYSKYVIGVIGDLEEKGNIQLYYGIDDSGNSDNNIQRNDIEYIRSTLKSNNVNEYIFDGVFSLSEEAYANMVLNAINREVKVKVRYYGDANQVVAGTTKNYSTIMGEVTSKLGLKEVEDGADVEILVYTRNGEGSRDVVSRELINQYLANINNHVPTILINDADYTNDYILTNYLTDFETNKIPMGYLIGYSNWYSFIHSSRIAISTGVVRYLYLVQGTKKEECDRGFVKMIVRTYYEDIAYLPNQSGTDIRSVEAAMDAKSKQISNNFIQGNIITNLVKYEENGVRSLDAYNYKFSWGRASEIDFDISVTLDDDRHSIKVIESF